MRRSLNDLDSISPPKKAVEMLVKPIAFRARHYEPVNGGVDIRIHVVVTPTASIDALASGPIS